MKAMSKSNFQSDLIIKVRSQILPGSFYHLNARGIKHHDEVLLSASAGCIAHAKLHNASKPKALKISDSKNLMCFEQDRWVEMDADDLEMIDLFKNYDKVDAFDYEELIVEGRTFAAVFLLPKTHRLQKAEKDKIKNMLDGDVFLKEPLDPEWKLQYLIHVNKHLEAPPVNNEESDPDVNVLVNVLEGDQ